ncbi:MAG: CdaR family protein [candidate division WOR-3 bacterium]|nr:CdaR family protein [candidate division WOR-3 bacterium]MCX7757037.1 CdaR family protein [candidate division WOR-3 bacterium]MDW7988398.1 CdaR family protein [candidate division WOR-3 bacterium]
MRIIKLFFADFGAKLLALVLAIFIWFLAVLFRTSKVNVNIPLEFSNVPQELIITEYSPKQVVAEIEGKGSDLVKLALSKPIYKLNLNNLRYGRNFYRINFADVTISSGIIVKSFYPETIFVKSDFRARKPISVFVPYKTEIPQDIYISEVEILDNVILEGPESQIFQITELATESLEVTNSESLQIQKKLRILLPNEQLFRVKPESVLVKIRLEKEATKTFDSLKLQVMFPQKVVVKFKPQLATIMVSGPESKIANLKPEDIIIRLNLSGFKVGNYKLPAEIILPPQVYLKKCEPKIFEVEIKERR